MTPIRLPLINGGCSCQSLLFPNFHLAAQRSSCTSLCMALPLGQQFFWQMLNTIKETHLVVRGQASIPVPVRLSHFPGIASPAKAQWKPVGDDPLCLHIGWEEAHFNKDIAFQGICHSGTVLLGLQWKLWSSYNILGISTSRFGMSKLMWASSSQENGLSMGRNRTLEKRAGPEGFLPLPQFFPFLSKVLFLPPLVIFLWQDP